ncbi:hypothetical protein HS088_TW14G00767 [Tripterygium wilfordii]|uniref:Uncharacterized protein n=1 Tax=Tripterygium wilfordii TaxID=458696 RepID=A0A7J7CR85_TRIWF|nr:hypothetical protein HS088_TW14G00767 [Tripterygium wilfordii]
MPRQISPNQTQSSESCFLDLAVIVELLCPVFSLKISEHKQSVRRRRVPSTNSSQVLPSNEWSNADIPL